MICTTFGCKQQTMGDTNLCPTCVLTGSQATSTIKDNDIGRRGTDTPMSTRYPKYYKPVPAGVNELDVYAVCQMFPFVDPSGAINHARKKLLVPGERTGGKTPYDDIKEARDTLTRWLELNKL